MMQTTNGPLQVFVLTPRCSRVARASKGEAAAHPKSGMPGFGKSLVSELAIADSDARILRGPLCDHLKMR